MGLQTPTTSQMKDDFILFLNLYDIPSLTEKENCKEKKDHFFCPRRKSRGLCDGRVRVVCLFVVCNHGYLWNPHSDFDETWPIMFLGYKNITQQLSTTFD